MRVMNRVERAAVNANLFEFFVFRRGHRHLSCEPMKANSLGQLIMTGVPGKELDAKTAQLFRRVQPGAFILFGRNIESPAQLRKLIDDLRDLSAVEPIITIDQESGRVSRLRLIGNEPPNAQQLRDKDDVDNSLRGRCYGKTLEQVIRNAGAFNEAMREQGIASCGKHFPGYSAATSDAHFQLPRIDRTREELDRNELAVFREFVRDVDSMMICHAWYPCFERQPKPATVSRRIVKELLRNEFAFDGLIMTDDLDMGAILTGYRLDDTIRLALEAGNDIMMICHRVPEIETVHRILGTLHFDQIERAQQHIGDFKKNLLPPRKFSESAFQEINREIADLRTAVAGEEEASGVVTERQISPVERF